MTAIEKLESYVWLRTSYGSILRVEKDVALVCPVFYTEILENNMGSSESNAIVLSKEVDPAALVAILDYCRFYQESGHSDLEEKAFHKEFLRTNKKILCEIICGAKSLDLLDLFHLSRRALSRTMSTMSAEEIRDVYDLDDDFIKENNLGTSKKSIKELKDLEQTKNIEVEEPHVDERSVDDLLSFINGEEKESNGGKSKKKNRRKKKHVEACSEFLDATEDPATEEALDREIEDFTLRLTSDWPEVLDEILSTSGK